MSLLNCQDDYLLMEITNHIKVLLLYAAVIQSKSCGNVCCHEVIRDFMPKIIRLSQ